MTMKLCLLGIEKVTLKDKTTHEDVIKYKHIFRTQNNNVVLGWADEQKFFDRISDSDTYNEQSSHVYEVRISSFGDKITYKVVL